MSALPSPRLKGFAMQTPTDETPLSRCNPVASEVAGILRHYLRCVDRLADVPSVSPEQAEEIRKDVTQARAALRHLAYPVTGEMIAQQIARRVAFESGSASAPPRRGGIAAMQQFLLIRNRRYLRADTARSLEVFEVGAAERGGAREARLRATIDGSSGYVTLASHDGECACAEAILSRALQLLIHRMNDPAEFPLIDLEALVMEAETEVGDVDVAA
jgi:hypothetical protein